MDGNIHLQNVLLGTEEGDRPYWLPRPETIVYIHIKRSLFGNISRFLPSIEKVLTASLMQIIFTQQLSALGNLIT